MFRFAAPTLLLVALAFGACNGDDGEPASPSPTEPPNATTASDPTSGPEPTNPPQPVPPGPFQGSREPVEVVSDSVPLPLLVEVRSGAHDDFDRVVFEFRASRPGYRVEYVDEATACGSGMAVELVGGRLTMFQVPQSNLAAVQQIAWTLSWRIISAREMPSSPVLIAPAMVTNICPPPVRNSR